MLVQLSFEVMALNQTAGARHFFVRGSNSEFELVESGILGTPDSVVAVGTAETLIQCVRCYIKGWTAAKEAALSAELRYAAIASDVGRPPGL